MTRCKCSASMPQLDDELYFFLFEDWMSAASAINMAEHLGIEHKAEMEYRCERSHQIFYLEEALDLRLAHKSDRPNIEGGAINIFGAISIKYARWFAIVSTRNYLRPR